MNNVVGYLQGDDQGISMGEGHSHVIFIQEFHNWALLFLQGFVRPVNCQDLLLLHLPSCLR